MPQDTLPWWATRYEAMAAVDPVFAGVVDPLAEAQVDLIERLADLHVGDRVLDVGCGAGRHSILMQERGFRATGVDLSQPLVDLAKQTWTHRHPGHPGPEFLCGDMRTLQVDGTFDLAIFMDETLGVFDQEADHLATLTSAAERLRDGGVIVVELFNPYFWAHRNLTLHYPPGALAEEADLVRTYHFDATRGRVEDRVILFRAGQRVELPTQSLRAWVPTEITALLQAAGFREPKVHGTVGWNVPGEPMPLDPQQSALMWVVARI